MTNPSPPRSTNRLIHETSPYLRQHAHNPVDWYPWGPEALNAARSGNKPIFLSLGYSACHWCHVMEHESFENPDIAAIMNDLFINIKVDREERPDLDHIYMQAVQLITRRGGWPMSVFLTPDLRPFYGGTYWPPSSRMGMPGFRDILLKIHEIWTTRSAEVDRSADQITQAIVNLSQPDLDDHPLDESLLRNAIAALLRSADPVHGGFGPAPKFPHPMDLRLLLRASRRFKNPDPLQVATHTLDHMARGGLYDHLGGGFHRYSTDERWLVPHFEKMLYDNALLVPAYLEAFQITGDTSFRTVVEQTLEYVLREMTAPNGSFYSTQDADSEGEEGKFFVWTLDEINALLPPEDARIFSYCYDVTSHGNWESHNILNRPKPHDQAARALNINLADLTDSLARSRCTLFETRKKRIPPGTDEKILVAWNGLLISALSLASRILAQPRYSQAAASAANFILNHITTPDGRLLHSFKDGQARIPAFLDDYACFIDGLCELYQATFVPRWLEHALKLTDDMLSLFRDPEGAFFFTPSDHETLITRPKDLQDSATPSGNSVAATALLKLGRLTGRTDLLDLGHQTLVALSGLMQQHPRAASQALLALDAFLGPAAEIVIIDNDSTSQGDQVLAHINSTFQPNILVVRVSPHDTFPTSHPLHSLLTGKSSPPGQTTIFSCDRGLCTEPLPATQFLARSFN